MNLIYQCFDKELPKWAQISSTKFRKYSEHVGAEYLCETKSVFAPMCPYYEHLKLIYDPLFEKYDKILYCDLDVVPEKQENIFDVPIEDVGMVAERQYPNMTTTVGFTSPDNQKMYQRGIAQFGLKGIQENGKYIIYNSGVILWSREGRMKARRSFIEWYKWWKEITASKQMKLDQPFINSQLEKLNLTELPLKWNCFPEVRWQPSYYPEDRCFVHYTNKKKIMIEEIYNED